MFLYVIINIVELIKPLEKYSLFKPATLKRVISDY